MAKLRSGSFLSDRRNIFRCAHRPELTPIVLDAPDLKAELHADAKIVGEAEFPELVGNIFGCVGRSSIAFDENLVASAVSLAGLRLPLAKGQYPAACRRACFRFFQQIALTKHVKCASPQS